MFENVEFDVENGKLKAYVTSNVKIKRAEVTNEHEIRVFHEFGSLMLRSPCPVKEVKSLEDLGSGLYIITVEPKGDVPETLEDDEWTETSTTISSGLSDSSSSPKRRDIDVGDLLFLEKLAEEFEDLDEELKKALEEDIGEDDEEDEEEEENVEEEGYDLYEKPIEDEEEVEDGVVVETEDDYEPF